MELSIRYAFVPKAKSLASSLVMDAFGVRFDQGDHVICDRLPLEIEPGRIMLFTGPSGSGKSSLLREVSRQLQEEPGNQLVDIMAVELPEKPLVDALPMGMTEGLNLLSVCGLSEAQLLLRTPAELSEGQRYRFRLALGLAMLQQRSGRQGWLVADEFTATLDRTLAKVLAYNLSRAARRMGIGCLLATTHEDVAEDLGADVRVRADLDGGIEVELPPSGLRPDAPEVTAKGGTTKRISFFQRVGTARAPVLTGPTLPLGITAATRWASSSE